MLMSVPLLVQVETYTNAIMVDNLRCSVRNDVGQLNKFIQVDLIRESADPR